MPWFLSPALSRCRVMSTDVHGGIEFRRPGVHTGNDDGEPWVRAMGL